MVKYIVIPLILFLLHVIVNLPGLRLYITIDEGSAVYIAREINKGLLPYLEIQVNHPPLYYYLLIALWRAFGIENPWTRWLVAKLVIVVSTAFTGVLIYLISARLFKSIAAGIFSSILLLFSHFRYYFGSSADSKYFALMLTTLALYLILVNNKQRKARYIAFFILSLACLSRLEPLTLILPFFTYSLLSNKEQKIKKFLTYLMSFILPFLPLVLAIPLLAPATTHTIFMWTGLAKVEGVVPYHSLSEKVDILRLSLEEETLLFTIALVGIPFFLLSEHVELKKRIFILANPLIIIVALYFLTSWTEAHRTYFAEPFFAIIGGSIMDFVKNEHMAKRFILLDRGRRLLTRSLVIIFLIFIMLFPSFVNPWRFDLLYPQVYHWIENRDGRSIYLAEIVNLVRGNSQSGDYIIAPHIVAFLADRNEPPWLTTNTTMLVKASMSYDVKMIVIPEEETHYLKPLRDFFRGYVSIFYKPVDDVPYYGDIFVRKQTIDMSKLKIEYDDGYSTLYGYSKDPTSNGSEGWNLCSILMWVGKAYIERKIYLLNGTYNFHTRACARGNTILIEIDDFTVTVKEPYHLDSPWILLKIGTFSLSEGLHTFRLSFVDGEMNDLQDYLLIEAE